MRGSRSVSAREQKHGGGCSKGKTCDFLHSVFSVPDCSDPDGLLRGDSSAGSGLDSAIAGLRRVAGAIGRQALKGHFFPASPYAGPAAPQQFPGVPSTYSLGRAMNDCPAFVVRSTVR